MNSNLKLHS